MTLVHVVQAKNIRNAAAGESNSLIYWLTDAPKEGSQSIFVTLSLEG